PSVDEFQPRGEIQGKLDPPHAPKGVCRRVRNGREPPIPPPTRPELCRSPCQSIYSGHSFTRSDEHYRRRESANSKTPRDAEDGRGNVRRRHHDATRRTPESADLGGTQPKVPFRGLRIGRRDAGGIPSPSRAGPLTWIIAYCGTERRTQSFSNSHPPSAQYTSGPYNGWRPAHSPLGPVTKWPNFLLHAEW